MALLTLFVNSQAVETRQFPTCNLKIEGYLQGLKLDMLEQNDEVVSRSEAEPEFRMVPSKEIICN